MITITNKQFINDYYNAISGKEKTASVVDQYVSDPELKGHIKFFETAFPKYEMVIDDMICEDDKVVIRARGKGVHKGDLMGIAPTGKSIDLPFIAIYQVANGKITKSWLSVDQMEMLKQLGIK